MSQVNGNIDKIEGQYIFGWCARKSDASIVIEVTLIIDGQIIKTVKADQFREDLAAAGIGDGKHGFNLVLPSGCFDGNPHECRVVIGDTNIDLEGSPFTFKADLPVAQTSSPKLDEPVKGDEFDWLLHDDNFYISAAELRYCSLYGDVAEELCKQSDFNVAIHFALHGEAEGRIAPTSIVPFQIFAAPSPRMSLVKGELTSLVTHNSQNATTAIGHAWIVVDSICDFDFSLAVGGEPVPTKTVTNSVHNTSHTIIFATLHADIRTIVDKTHITLIIQNRNAVSDKLESTYLNLMAQISVEQLPQQTTAIITGWVRGKKLAELSLHAALPSHSWLQLEVSEISENTEILLPSPRRANVEWFSSRCDLSFLSPGHHKLNLILESSNQSGLESFGPFGIEIPTTFQFPAPRANFRNWKPQERYLALLSKSSVDLEKWIAQLSSHSLIAVADSINSLKSIVLEKTNGVDPLVIVPEGSNPLSAIQVFEIATELESTSRPLDLTIARIDRDDTRCVVAKLSVLDRILNDSASTFISALTTAPLRVLVQEPSLIVHVENIESRNSPKHWLRITGWLASNIPCEPLLSLIGLDREIETELEWIPRPDVLSTMRGYNQNATRGFILDVAWHSLPVQPETFLLRGTHPRGAGEVEIPAINVPPILSHLEHVQLFQQVDGHSVIRIVGWAISHCGETPLFSVQIGGHIFDCRAQHYWRPDVKAHLGVPWETLAGFTIQLSLPLNDVERLDLRVKSNDGLVVIPITNLTRAAQGIIKHIDTPMWGTAGSHLFSVSGYITSFEDSIQWVELRCGQHVLARDFPVTRVSKLTDITPTDYCGFDLSAKLSRFAGQSVDLEIVTLFKNSEHVIQTFSVDVPDLIPSSANLIGSWDSPIDGAAIPEGELILIQGWALSLTGTSIEIRAYDGDVVIGRATPSKRRVDVQEAYDLSDEMACVGFMLMLDRLIRPGEELFIGLEMVDVTSGESISLGKRRYFGGLQNSMTGRRLRRWYEANALTNISFSDASQMISTFKYKPLISIIMPHYKPMPEWLDRAIESVNGQWYRHFELCIVDDGSGSAKYRNNLEALCKRYTWIRWGALNQNQGIAAASNAAVKLARGEFIVLLDQDDELAANCLFEFVKRLNVNSTLDIIYSDSDKIDTSGRHFDLTLKPEFDPSMLLSYMYMNHALLIRRTLFKKVGGFRLGFDGAQDHDLALRLVENTVNIAHIPSVLYHWRVIPGSTALSGSEKPQSFDAARRAIADALLRRGFKNCDVIRPDWAEKAGVGIYRVKWNSKPTPLVSIVIPTHDHGALLRRCIDSIRTKTTYKRYEIIVVDDRSTDQGTLLYLSALNERVITVQDRGQGFNFSELINKGVKVSSGDYVILLNNDTEVISPDWIEELLGWARQDDIGVVGCRLLFPGSSVVQHAGLARDANANFVGHLFRGEPAYSGGYHSWPRIARSVDSVTFAAAMISRKTFDLLNGLDEIQFPRAYQDPDFCLRAREKGFRVVYTAHAELIHAESVSKPRRFMDTADRLLFKMRWNTQDPYLNPNIQILGEQPTPQDRRILVTNPHASVRIAALASNLRLQGAPTSQYLMLTELITKHGFEVHLLCLGDGPLRAHYIAAGAIVTDLPRQINVTLQHFAKDWIRQIEPDVVYANTLEADWFVNVSIDLGFPTFWNIRESSLPKDFYRGDPIRINQCERALTHCSRLGFVACSTYDLFKASGLQLSNHCVIENGVDLSEFRPKRNAERTFRRDLNIPPRSLIFGTVGTVCPRKGQHLALASFIELQRRMPDANLWFVSVGESPPSLSTYHHLVEQVAKTSPLPDRIIFLPETGSIAEIYRGFDVFVTASLEESFPRVIIEAMASGIPVIASRVFGVAEQVIQGFTGFTVEPGNVLSFCDSMEALAKSTVLRKEMRLKSRSMAEASFGLYKMVDRYATEFRLLREELSKR